MWELSTVAFVDMANDALPAYAKQLRGNSVITVVNVDPHLTRKELAIVTAQLGLPLSFIVHDVLFNECFQCRIVSKYVRVGSRVRRAHVDRVEV